MNKLHVLGAVVAVALAAASALAEEMEGSGNANNKAFNAVVKLDVATAKSDILCPWVNRNNACVGSGVVIGDGRILTCAHCVADASYIRVSKHNEDTIYHATVLFFDNDADLALVGVEDPKFMEDVVPMEIGDTPRVQDDVLAVGYPIGGEDISYTRGIVSRIEDIEYALSLADLLAIQVDAAINPGNSGGPVLDMESGKIVGIAFQGAQKEETESLGYVIPPEIIRHFLKDIEDGRVDGFPMTLFASDFMENPVKRRYYRMAPDQSGVVVCEMDSALGDDSIKIDDVILEIDGYKVSNNARIRLAGGEPRSLSYPVYTRQIGEKVPVKVLRGGKVVETSIKAAKKNCRIKLWLCGEKPDWFVYGGFVFTPVSLDYVVRRSKARFHDDLTKGKESPDDEPVVISWCFADKGIVGYLGARDSLVRSVNGEKVRNIRHLVELIERCDDGFVCFGLDKNTEYDVKMIVDAKEMRVTTARVMKRNLIPADRSESLRRK